MSATNAAKTRDEQPQTRPQKITTFLSFDQNAEEAANFYVSVFKNARIINTARYTEAGPRPEGSVMIVDFELEGVRYTALNGGPEFNFNQGISLLVHCQDQEEVDYYWDKLSEGGEILDCGWLKDKFGVSWQITPDVLLELIQDSDRAKAARVMEAMMKMKKIEIKDLEEAAR